VKLLRAEVELCQKDPAYLNKTRSVRSIPWKKVGERIFENGASYPFGPTTCARKWEEVMRKKEEVPRRKNATGRKSDVLQDAE